MSSIISFTLMYDVFNKDMLRDYTINLKINYFSLLKTVSDPVYPKTKKDINYTFSLPPSVPNMYNCRYI